MPRKKKALNTERLPKSSEILSEPRQSQLIHGLSIAAFVIDDLHCITHCNKAFEKLTGLSADSLIGTQNQWQAFYPTERLTLADYVVQEATEEQIARHYGDKYQKSTLIEGAYEVEDFFPNLSSGGKWLFFTAAPLHDAQGRVNGAIETLQDITDRKKSERALQKSERRLRALLDFEPYPVVVFTLDGLVSYLNPAFTEIFGWTLEELEGGKIPYVPAGLKQETDENIKRLLYDRVIMRYEAQRLTKDGRLLDVVIRAAVFSISPDEPAGQIVTLRDVTREKRMARANEALLRISLALPLYPDLEDLLDYVNEEVKTLLHTEGAVTILLDEERQELFFPGAAFDEALRDKKIKEIRFPIDGLMAGKVIRTGKPLIVANTSEDLERHAERDEKLGYQTRTLALVPLKSVDRIIGALCAINKKEDSFIPADLELLNMIAGTVALSIENARVSQELQKAYREVTSLNRAKDKAINHLSHELITPVAILSSSLRFLSQKNTSLREEAWRPAVERIKRNLNRILEIQYQLEDIMSERPLKTAGLLSLLLDQCVEELAAVAVEYTGEEGLYDRIKKHIDRLYGPREAVAEEIVFDQWVLERLRQLESDFSHRLVKISTRLEPDTPILFPAEILRKIFNGLLRNAIENTPDEGTIEISVRRQGDGALLRIHDYGQGITEENQKRLFEGFFPTQEVMDYSSKRHYAFNAGGKGADLLRIKILSERYGFQITETSRRCRFIPGESDLCPGRISRCPFCQSAEDCLRSGETEFSVFFPKKPAENKNEANLGQKI
jgi:PAS domain S-box-containing protein